MKKLKQHISNLNKSIYTGERFRQNIAALTLCGAITGPIGIIMTVMNVLQHKGFITYTTALIALCGGFIVFSARILKKREPAIIATTLTGLVFFTYYAVSGANEGFAILWTMILPILVCYFMSVRYGILASVYFELLFAVLFYTPLRAHFTGLYTETFMNRYPILYLCMVLLIAVAFTQYHESVLVEIEYTEKLNAEVARQTRFATERADKLQRLSDEMVLTLARAIDAKDKYTRGHSLRVSEYAAALADALDWENARKNALMREALLHDIGKIGVPDTVLNKPGRLNVEEYSVIKSHTTVGSNILNEIEDMTETADVALYHHERYDGSGYPTGRSGKNIPENARIISIADAFDAMYSDRVYRKALPVPDIIADMESQRGRQFDPELLDVFLGLVKNGSVLENGRHYRT